jgi:Fic family protein
MLSFTPSSKIEKELRNLQGLLAGAFNTLSLLPTDESDYLRHCAFISTIGASTRIENAVLTDPEIQWVDTTLTADGRPSAFDEKKASILDKLSKDRERSVEEVVGCRELLSTILFQAKELFPLTETTLRGLHQVLLSHYPPAGNHAGSYKTAPNRVVAINHTTGEERVVLDPAPPGIVTETAMADLVRWYNSALREHPWPLLVATEFVFRFLAIHPFQDGNGRLGRALFLLALLQSDDEYLPGIIPCTSIDRQIERSRPAYYSVLRKVSEGEFEPDPANYDMEPLVWFFLKMLRVSLLDISIYRQRYSDLNGLSGTAMNVLEIFKSNPERRLKVAEVVEVTGHPRRTVQYALRSLTDKGFLQALGKGAGSRYQLVF